MSTKVITGTCRASSIHLFEPHSIGGCDPKYSLIINFPRSDTETLKRIQIAIDEAIQRGVSNKWGGKRPLNLQLPLLDGDDEHPNDTAFGYHINCSSVERPNVVDHNRNPITDPNAIRTGCCVRVSIHFYPSCLNNKLGVIAGLGNVQLLEDSMPLND